MIAKSPDHTNTRERAHVERKGKCQSLSQLMAIILKITTLPTSRSGNYTEISNGTQYQILDLKKKNFNIYANHLLSQYTGPCLKI